MGCTMHELFGCSSCADSYIHGRGGQSKVSEVRVPVAPLPVAPLWPPCGPLWSDVRVGLGIPARPSGPKQRTQSAIASELQTP